MDVVEVVTAEAAGSTVAEPFAEEDSGETVSLRAIGVTRVVILLQGIAARAPTATAGLAGVATAEPDPRGIAQPGALARILLPAVISGSIAQAVPCFSMEG